MNTTFCRAPFLVVGTIFVVAILVSASDPGPAPYSNRSGKDRLARFWAVWCHGCQEEIPWFVEFQRRYVQKDFAVLGVSLDGDGWKVVTPL